MAKKICAGWIITNDDYDNMKPTGWLVLWSIHLTKRDAIKHFLEQLSGERTWAQYRREGWRAVRCNVTWN